MRIPKEKKKFFLLNFFIHLLFTKFFLSFRKKVLKISSSIRERSSNILTVLKEKKR